jgi:ParB-like chromosome segregation protein Spo0J
VSTQIKFRYLDADTIRVPDVRVTSIWSDEEYAEFQRTIATDGIGVPLKCVLDGETWWLIDGLHRLEEAKRLGQKKVPVAYTEGSMVDALLKNLYLNRVRGRTPASDEIKLIQHLLDKYHMSLTDISRKTGMSMELMEQRLQIARAGSYVKMALETGQIGVGVAFQLSRLPHEEGQTILLARLLQAVPPATTAEVQDIVEGSLKIIQEREQTTPRVPETIPVKTLRCHLCGQAYEPGDLRGINVCVTCHGLSRDWIQNRLKGQAEKTSPAEALAQKIARGELSEADKAAMEANLRR